MLDPKEWLWQKFIGFITQKPESVALSPHDTECLHTSLKPADVLLLEGRSRVGSIIKIVTRSSWSHSAIFIGSLNSKKEPELKARIAQHWQGEPDELLLIEAEIDCGTVVTPFSHYTDDLNAVLGFWVWSSDQLSAKLALNTIPRKILRILCGNPQSIVGLL